MDPIGIVRLGDENFEFPIMEGTEAELAIDLRTFRSKTGHIAFDEGYGNTGSCESGITFINGEKGIQGIVAIRLSNLRNTPHF